MAKRELTQREMNIGFTMLGIYIAIPLYTAGLVLWAWWD